MDNRAKCVALRSCFADELASVVYGFADDGRFVAAENWSIDNLASSSSSRLRSTLDKFRGQFKNLAVGRTEQRMASLQSSSSSSVAGDLGIAVTEKTIPPITIDSRTETSQLTIPLVDPNDYWAPIAMANDDELERIGLSPLGDRVTRACLAQIEACLKILRNIKTRAEFPRTSNQNADRSHS